MNRLSGRCIATIALLLPIAAIAQAPLPDDVDPRTRNRLPPAGADAVPGVAGILEHGSDIDVRFEAGVGRALSELSILVVARAHDQPYEWSLHELEAVAVGLDLEAIEAVKHRRALTGLGEEETVIIQMGRELFDAHALSAETYAHAVRLFGQTGLVDVVSLMGNYVATAVRLTAFNQHLPPGWRQFLPLPFEQPDDVLAETQSRLPPAAPRPRSTGGRPPARFSRGLAPAGTGPALIRGHSSGQAALERSVGRGLMDLAVLIAARAYDAQYLWTTTEPAAREHGLEPAVIDAVRDGSPTAGLPDREAALIDFGRELFGAHTVEPQTYLRARERFGQNDLVDLVNLMASTAEEATLLAAFDQRLPAGERPLLPAR